MGFSRMKPHERVASYVFFRIVLEFIYMGSLKERHVHPWKHEKLSLYNREKVARVGRYCL